jgi:D-xylose transport system substrate-binding protein
MNKKHISALAVLIAIIFVFYMIFGSFIGRGIFKRVDNIESEEVVGYYKIGLSFDSLVVERWQRDLETFISYAGENDIEVNVQIANDDIKVQKKQILGLIEDGIDVLVILPGKHDAFVEELTLAANKGIKIVAYDRLITGVHIDGYVSFDDDGIGNKLAQRIIEGLSKIEKQQKNIVIINGDPNDNNSKILNDGFKNSINESEDETLNIVAEVWAEGWREDVAYDIVEEMLDKGVTIDAVIAANDTLATGAIQAISERKLLDKTLVVGQDAELSACQRIVEGTQLATIYKPINTLSKAAVDFCVSHLLDFLVRECH